MFSRLLLKPRFKNKIINVYYSTKNSNKNQLYSDTIFLPKTLFPLRLENEKFAQRDQQLSKMDEFRHLYKWQRSYLSEPEFVLHDGPPYANGKLHMGHALNKILKDTILRYQILKGNKVHYVPGWDCHGLPIELKAISTTSQSPLEIRSKARAFAKSTINDQKEVFKSWGILGDWNHHYATYNPDYLKLQIKFFYKLYEKNLVYRAVKPIYWSPSSKTALAEAELEYNEKHISPSIFVKFQMKHIPNKDCTGISALVWTTTPWTLPSNQAICYNPQLSYSLVKKTDDHSVFIVASDLIESLSNTFNTKLEIIEKLYGDVLSKYAYIHPIYKEKVLHFIPSSHATASKGTGLVHTAPAHGPEDFLVALNEKMEIVNLVNEFGCYNSLAGPNLEGKFVLEEGTRVILEMLKPNIVHYHDYIHSYPYDWRTKKPVIIRASKQWFIDTNSIKNRAIDLLENVQIIPKTNSEIYKRNLINQIEKRPYWCISRQRKWGVPIPIFFNKNNEEVIISEDLIRHLRDLIDNHGTDFWWKLPLEQLIPEEYRNGLLLDNIEKGQDILDIWFDSGISWANALEGDKIADMYLEGVDQFTGWFQSSLITSVALRDKAPYKSIYVHGFVVDEKGMKMSKSLGNVVDPMEIVKGSKNKKAYGIDTLRWWVVCHANQDSLTPISYNVLQASADELQKIRSVIRFALGSLSDYDGAPINYQNLALLDKYMLHLLYSFHNDTQEAITNYQFQRICINVINLFSNQVSALYYTAIKDRLYCNSLDSKLRKACQYVLYQIFEIVTQAIAPIVPHLVEEMYLHLPYKTGKIYFMATHSKPIDEWNNLKVEDAMNVILAIKKDINKNIGAKTSNAAIKIELNPKIWTLFKDLTPHGNIEMELIDILQVSEVLVSQMAKEEKYKIEHSKTKKFLCARCRRAQSSFENELCERCNQVMDSISSKVTITN